MYIYIHIYVCIYNICIYIHISKGYLISISSFYCISYDSWFGCNRNF